MSTEYNAFSEQLDNAIAAYPSLKRVFINQKEILKGNLQVIDGEGKYWDDYDIEIHAPSDITKEFPKLFETSGKIPKIGDWHIYEDTLSCCVKIRPLEILRCKRGVTVTEYIKEEVMPYLFNQTHRRVEGYYVNGEYAHGGAGIFQYYSEILKTGNNIKRTLELMKFISSNELPNRVSFCFCGSNIKFRNCHKEAFILLKLIGDDEVKNHAYNIAIAATHI